MNSECGKEWTRKFIKDVFPGSFVEGPLKRHREDVLYDKERALLPATQPYAEALRRNTAITRELLEIRNQMKILQQRGQQLMNERGRLANPEAVASERRQFIKPCPVDDCRGFLSSQWKCGMCSVWACPDCHAIIGESKDAAHICDADDVASAKLIASETRPCPKCHISIHKIDGCDQIWCTQCHTAFSYRTGTIEDNIHNPHYYEWLRKTQGNVPRNPLDNPCAEVPLNRLIEAVEDALLRKRISTHPILHDMDQYVRNLIHLRRVELPTVTTDYEKKNRDIRVGYLIGFNDDAKMKLLLQRSEKKHMRDTEIRDVFQMILTVGEDLLMRFLRDLRTKRELDMSAIHELVVLRVYANECLADIIKTYGSKIVIKFEDCFRISRNNR